MAQSRPNVLLLVPHDAGDYLGCYGRRVETPNLDRLASEGTRFANHFCTAPMCSPSRASLITGKYPHSNGLMGLVDRGWNLPDSNITDAQRFSDAGYATYLIGGQHEKRRTADLGFEHVLADVPESRGRLSDVVNTVTELLSDIECERRKRPFYMRIGTSAAHRDPDLSVIESLDELADSSDAAEAGYAYRWAHADGISESEVEIFPQWVDTPALRHDLNGFTGVLKRLDHAIGAILAALRDTGLAEETIVVYVPDHGIDYPRGKGTLYDLGIKTACIVRVPGTGRGTVVSGLSSHVDILPTLLELCGISDDQGGIQGCSLAGLVRGLSRSVRAEIHAEDTTFPANRMRCIRTSRFKLIRNFDTGRKSCAAHSGAYVIQGSGSQYFVDRVPVELYDLEQDPFELNNLAGSTDHARIEASLSTRLDEWMRTTRDPILEGVRIARPPEEQEVAAALSEEFRQGTNEVWAAYGEHFDTLWS